MTKEEAIARIKDHMFVHKMHEERAVKITEAFNMAISALEQPEIVRCKDCKHQGTKNCVANVWATIFGVTVKDDFYCGLAERRTANE